MPPKKYVSIYFHAKTVKAIQNCIDEHPELGYTTVPEFVRDAARRLLRIIITGVDSP